MRSSTAEKVNAAFAIALAIVAAIGVSSITSIQRFLATSQEVSRTYSVLAELQGVLALLTEAESAQRSYVLTGDDTYLQPFEGAAATVTVRIRRISEGAVTDTGQQRRLADLATLVARRLALLQQVTETRRSDDVAAATESIRAGHGREVMDSIRGVITEFDRVERGRLDRADRSATARARIATAIITGGGVFAFLIVLVSAVAIRRDFTERRRAEQALRESETLLSQFMENLPMGVIVVDRHHSARFANNAAVDILGPGILIDTGSDPLPLYHAADGSVYPIARRPVERALSGQTTTVDDAAVEVNGRTLPLQVSAAPIYDASGRIAYAIMAFSDISQRRRTEEALRDAKEAAETASRTKSEFLARMSHELRTPLNSVIGFANILLKNKAGNLRDQDIAYIDRIQDNGKHLLLLINDILDLSKIEAGKIEIETERVDLAALIETTAAQWEGQLAQAQLRLRTEVPAGLAPLHTDGNRLKQVLLNLIGNAVKFTKRGEIVIEVEPEPGGTRAARIHVIDTGIGIAPDRLAAIFDAFEQAESSTSRKYGGTGLGLPISRALCDLLGFELHVHSEVDVGSRFTIDLMPQPAVTPAALAQPLADILAVRGATGRSPAERLVLIVDDEPDSRIMLTHYVEEFGCRAIATHSAASALQLARQLRPQLITLDLMMPEMNGWDLLAQLKADPALADIPVVVASIVAEESRASLIGAIDLLQKPLDRDDLFAVLHRNLGTGRSRILVVEDAQDDRTLLCQLLAERTSELRTAANGEEALAVLREFEPDLVIVDLLMPVMDGMTFLEVFRSTPRFQHVPAIVVTAKDLAPDERERLARHTAAVLRKGNALETDLRRVLGSVLARPAFATTGDGPAADRELNRG
jgi:PAS domain S-box-containing protein